MAKPAAALVTLTGALSYSYKGYKFEKDCPIQVGNASDIAYFQANSDFSVVPVEAATVAPKLKAAPVPVEEVDETTDTDGGEVEEDAGEETGLLDDDATPPDDVHARATTSKKKPPARKKG